MKMYKKGDIILFHVKHKDSKYCYRGKHLGIVVSNNKHNNSANTLLILPLSSKIHKANNRFNILIQREEADIPLNKDSICLINQLQTISKENVIRKISHIDTKGKLYKFLMKKICNFIND